MKTDINKRNTNYIDIEENKSNIISNNTILHVEVLILKKTQLRMQVTLHYLIMKTKVYQTILIMTLN